MAYGFIPNEAGAAFGIGQMNRIEELWELRNSRFQQYYGFFDDHADKFIVPTLLPETETTLDLLPGADPPGNGLEPQEAADPP